MCARVFVCVSTCVREDPVGVLLPVGTSRRNGGGLVYRSVCSCSLSEHRKTLPPEGQHLDYLIAVHLWCQVGLRELSQRRLSPGVTV